MGDLSENERKLAWTEVWRLKNSHYSGLTSAERSQLISVFHDLLGYGKSEQVNDDWAAAGSSDPERPAVNASPAAEAHPLLDIHDPRHYLFGEGKKWIPWAKDCKGGSKRGTYADGYPRGIVLHWTAGHRNGIEAGNQLMRNTGMLYLIGDKDGNIGQCDSLAYWGYHAGRSSHPRCNGGVSDEFCGLELQAAGTLTKKGDKFYSWFNTEIPAEEVMFSETRGNIDRGFYHAFTEEQVLATRKLCCWLHLNNPDVFKIDNITSHDEISPGRKTDIGASMVVDGKALTISEFRALVESDISRILENRDS